MTPVRHRARRAPVRRIILALLLLLAGAAASAISAWAAVAFPKDLRNWTTSYAPPLQTEQGQLFATRYKAFGITTWQQVCFQYVNPAPAAKEGLRPPSWVRPLGVARQRSTCGCGYPFRCLKFETEPSKDNKGLHTRYAVTLYYWRSTSGDFPVLPIPEGMILNTIFYAALFSAPWTLRAVRRRRRIRHGHCPFCNYNLHGEFTRMCSECGRQWRGAPPSGVQA